MKRHAIIKWVLINKPANDWFSFFFWKIKIERRSATILFCGRKSDLNNSQTIYLKREKSRIKMVNRHSNKIVTTILIEDGKRICAQTLSHHEEMMIIRLDDRSIDSGKFRRDIRLAMITIDSKSYIHQYM